MTERIEINCPIWGKWGESFKAAKIAVKHEEYFLIESPRAGGKFKLLPDAFKSLNEDDRFKKLEFALVITDYIFNGSNPKIDIELLDRLLNTPAKGIASRANSLLKFYSQYSQNLGATIGSFKSSAVHSPPYTLLLRTSSVNFEELVFLWKFLKDQKFIAEGDRGSREVSRNYIPTTSIRPLGYNHLESLKLPNKGGKIVFIAMWFDNSMDPFRTAMDKAILACGYEPRRVDEKEFNGRIDDEIVSLIRQSKFIIADFTAGFYDKADSNSIQARGGTYWEAGFAAGLGKEVIFTCREDCIENVHFDTQSFKHIVWKDAADLETKLIHRISATII